MEAIVVEIREPGRKPRRVPVSASVEVGRGCKGILLADDAASRRHITLTPGPDGLYVTDLGSSNGTFVNDTQLSGRPHLIRPGDIVRLGETELCLADAPSAPVRNVDPPTVSAAYAEPSAPPPPRPRARTGARAVAAAPARKPALSRAQRPSPPPAAPSLPPAAELSLDPHVSRRLQAAHGWVDVEAGGVPWTRFLEAVVDVGLDNLAAVIVRLRAQGEPKDGRAT